MTTKHTRQFNRGIRLSKPVSRQTGRYFRLLQVETLEERSLLSAAGNADTLGIQIDVSESTGLVPPAEEQLQWERDHLTIKEEAVLNELGQRRLLEETSSSSLVDQPDTDASSRLSNASFAVVAAATESSAATAGNLPSRVDNSELPQFPGIRDQGDLNSCSAFATTYYALTHMTALARGWNASDPQGNSNKFSPKWTYNLLNNGSDGGLWITDAYELLAQHGAATWEDVPYDSDYLEWVYDDPDVWRDAINYRIDDYGYVADVDTSEGLDNVKTLLANGYVLNVGTYAYSWQFLPIGDDLSTESDDAYVGEAAIYWVSGTSGGHAVTVVGYDDNIWVDINGNGSVEEGEKGAFRIASSWGDDWNGDGFVWMSYDSLKLTSAVTGAPDANRQMGWWYGNAYWLTAPQSYTPTLLAEFTLQTAERNRVSLTLGTGGDETTAQDVWNPAAMDHAGGAYGLDGQVYSSPASAPDGTFVFDFTDLASNYGVLERYQLGLDDWTDSSLASTITSFQLIDAQGNVLADPADGDASANIPLMDANDGATPTYAFIDTALTNIVLGQTRIALLEGSTTQIEVSLASAPSENVTVSAAWRQGDSDISLVGDTSLVFTPTNWSIAQTITVGAAQDADMANGAATILFSGQNCGSVPLRIVESDDEAIYVTMMDTDPGWTLEGDWTYGQPQGSGGEYGNPDPVAGFSGENVLGFNLDGDYGSLATTQWATTPAIDCANYADVQVEFCRWLNVEQPKYDHAYVMASNDGVYWTCAWSNTVEITDSRWVHTVVDISAVADGRSTVYLRWGMGHTSSTWHYAGWNIDDVILTGTLVAEQQNHAPTLDDSFFSVAENAASGAVVGAVAGSDEDVPAQELTYAITAGNDDGVFAIASSAGQITVADNSALDYGTTSQYALTVQVADSGSPSLFDTATILVNVNPIDSTSEIGVFRLGYFYQDTSGDGSWGDGDQVFKFGLSTDTAIVGDWNGDGRDEVGIYRAGYFYQDCNGSGVWDDGDRVFKFGLSTDTPIIGDWNGDGVDEVGVRRSNSFYQDYNGSGSWDGGDRVFRFGLSADSPIIGDWNGDGKDEVGVHRANYFYRDYNNSGSWNSGDQVSRFGISTDEAITGDWNGDGKDEIGVHRANYFYQDYSGNGSWGTGDRVLRFGISGDTALIGNWSTTASLVAEAAVSSVMSAESPPANETVSSLLDAAIDIWSATGLTAAQVALLDQVEVQIADLADAQLGQASGTTITLDVDAAGYGWFLDATPFENEEFDLDADRTGLKTIGGLPASLRIDMLTVVMHELGHVLGFEHAENGVMQEALTPGTRWFLTYADSGQSTGSATSGALADTLFPNSVDAALAINDEA